jgi:hypothetical protein
MNANENALQQRAFESQPISILHTF